jgi:hypothetical protein
MSGISKDFIFEISMPANPFKVGDHECNPILLLARIVAYDIDQVEK